jgi:DNA-binding MarR family transcriptional regulator
VNSRIETTIKQSQFDNIYQKALIGLMLVNSRLEEQQNNVLKNHGISLQQYNVLRILRGQDPNPCSLQLVRDRMIDRMSDTSRIVERLRQSGLLTRLINKTDRRSVDIRITQKGIDCLALIDKEVDKFYIPLKKLEINELAQLTELIAKVL